MRTAVSTLLAISMILIPAASAQTSSADESPEDVVRAAYASLSFDPNVPSDRATYVGYLADDSVVAYGTSPEDASVMPADEFLDKIQERVQAGEYGGVGHTMDLEEVQCWVVGEVAKCMVDYRRRDPAGEDLASTEGVLLKRIDGRWLITSINWLVRSLDETDIVPTIDPGLLAVPTAGRGLQPTLDAVWNRALPLLGKKVVAKGFSLPNPYGVALVGAWKRQDITLGDLSIRAGGSEWTTISFPLFEQPSADTFSYQAKFDFWLFPFLNVYALVGRVDGDSLIPVSFLGSDLMDLIGTGDLCDGLRPPAACYTTYSGTYTSDIGGDNVSIGLNPALGYKDFFFTMPVTWTWTDLDTSDRLVESFYLSPRIGLSVPTERSGALSVYIGAAYLKAENFIVGSIDLPTSGMPGAEDGLRVEYEVWADNTDRWNYLVGFNWAISTHWQLHAEADAGGSRQGATVSATWRF